MKSPIAPPRITRMRFICRKSAVIDRRYRKSIPRDGVRENRSSVKQGQAVRKSPAPRRARTPIYLIAQKVRHRDPEQSNDDQKICEHRHKKPAGFGAKESGIEQRLGAKKKKNAER